MTDTRFVPVDEVVREEAREPAKRWRLKYRFPRNVLILCLTCKRMEPKRRGIVWSCATFPSKDVALTAAERHDQSDLKSCEFLGAFPVEDT